MFRPQRLLVINPNTSTRVTASIDALVREEVGAAAEIRSVTATFGFRYIASRAAVSIAAHAVLDTAAAELAAGAAPDAILLACFGDPGLDALVEMTGLPVVGFAEAGLLAAAEGESTFTVATNGAVWCEMLAELAQRLSLADKVAAIDSIENVGSDPAAIAAFLTARARETGASRIVLGGAGLIPILPQVVALAGLPVLDPHREGIRKVLRLANLPKPGGLPAPAGPQETIGLSPSLTRALSDDTIASRLQGIAG